MISKSPIKHDIDICKRIVHLENESKIIKKDIYGIKIPINQIWLEGDNKS